MVESNQDLKLVLPSIELEEEYLGAIAEYKHANENRHAFALAEEDFQKYLQKLQDEVRGINLPPGIVPMTTYWLVLDSKIILGESHLRHYLTPALLEYGGHIGYVIRPSQRRKGYGTLILQLALEKARDMGIQRVRITCDTDNIGSARVIEKNGGVLSGQMFNQITRKHTSQYWIDL